MLKTIYDKNNNGIVDNAEKVNNHTVYSDVPLNAVFTDTTIATSLNMASGQTIEAKINQIDQLIEKNNEYRKQEDRMILSQVLDKIEISEKREKIEYTDFLDLAQIELVQKKF